MNSKKKHIKRSKRESRKLRKEKLKKKNMDGYNRLQEKIELVKKGEKVSFNVSSAMTKTTKSIRAITTPFESKQ